MFGQAAHRALEKLGARVSAPVRVVLWDGHEVSLSRDPRITVRLNRAKAANALSRPSLLTLAQAYIDGDLDLEGDLEAMIAAGEALARSEGRGLFDGEGPRGSRHSRSQDRAAISHHYDVSNAFYALWLDERLVYSCAYFQSESDSLAEAQVAKLEHICRKLRLKAGECFLDIGCGWGALAIHAAQHHGVHATGVTLSENQFQLANERIQAAGLQDRCRVLLQDYRDHRSERAYDKIASVGMFEHVGLANLPVYFRTVSRLLRDRGLFLNHGITSSNTASHPVGWGAGEFIDRYVFPKGELAHLHLAVREMSEQQLEVHDVECLRPHYAKTLSHWSANFERCRAEAAALSSERTARIWRLYLAGCAHAFTQGWISIYQVLASKQAVPGKTELPLTRDWIYRR